MPEMYGPHLAYLVTQFPGNLLMLASMVLGGLIHWDVVATRS
jgi:hypothetical protein